jgi:thiamine biosynthesis protein ThiS
LTWVRLTPDTRSHPADAATTDARVTLVITLNGEQFELEEPMSVVALLAKLDIDPRRVAVEHNLAILKRQRFPEVIVGDGDRIEIVNFVGGG